MNWNPKISGLYDSRNCSVRLFRVFWTSEHYSVFTCFSFSGKENFWKSCELKIFWQKRLAYFWLCKSLTLLIYILINTVEGLCGKLYITNKIKVEFFTIFTCLCRQYYIRNYESCRSRHGILSSVKKSWEIKEFREQWRSHEFSYVVIVNLLIIMQGQKHCLMKCNNVNK